MLSLVEHKQGFNIPKAKHMKNIEKKVQFVKEVYPKDFD